MVSGAGQQLTQRIGGPTDHAIKDQPLSQPLSVLRFRLGGRLLARAVTRLKLRADDVAVCRAAFLSADRSGTPSRGPPLDFAGRRPELKRDLLDRNSVNLDSGMPRTKRYALGFLLGGLALAVATPAYVAHAAPHLAGYLLHPGLFLGQIVHYLLCGALWLPWRAPGAATTALVLSLLLLVAAVIIYVPMIWAPGAGGGDMVGLALVGVSAAMTVAFLLGSAVALLILWLGPRARRA